MQLSVAEWLNTRTPPAPSNLLARMLAELNSLGLSANVIDPKILSDTGASILKSLDKSTCTDRSSALDLLAADALFTYAIEASTDSIQEIESASNYVLEKVTSI